MTANQKRRYIKCNACYKNIYSPIDKITSSYFILICRDILGDMLFIADEIFQLSLLKVRRLCEEACGSLQREQASVFFVGEQFTDTLTLQQFVEGCLRQADVVREQLGSLRVSCQAISVQACQVSIMWYREMNATFTHCD